MSKIYFSHYNASDFSFSDALSLKQCAAYDRSNHVTWINIQGISDKELMQEAAEQFNIHPIALEDISAPRQRAKMEEYGDMLYVVLRMFYLKNEKIEDQQISFVLRDNQLITFRESDTGVFSRPVAEKLKNENSVLRKKGEDYLLYALLDVIIDNYYTVLETINEKLEKLEAEIFKNMENRHLRLLQELKSDVLYMRKNMLPARDLINNLMRNDVEYFDPANKYYLRDLQDHMQRNVEDIDFQWEQLNSVMELYYSMQNNRMNNVMKTLTGVSFVLLPLNFLASLYGMNFSVIPRAEDPWGFYEMVAAMAVIAIVLTIFAFRRNWLSSQDFNKEKE
ncbi:MAG: magnesium/cobalt transporter CorA [Chitinophagales bacterium]|nr:magnesium/cobalt transporter CorA [Chitinophagales bacterium]